MPNLGDNNTTVNKSTGSTAGSTSKPKPTTPTKSTAPKNATLTSASTGSGSSSSSGELSSTALMQVLYNAGFRGNDLVTAFGIAKAESQGNPGSYNPNAGTGDNSYGLFQINMLGNMGVKRLAAYKKKYGISSYDDLKDPVINAKIAYDMYKSAGNWSDWSTHPDSKARGGAGVGYEKYLTEAQQTYHSLSDRGTLGQMPDLTTYSPTGGVSGTGGAGSFSSSDLAHDFGYSAAFFDSDPSLKSLMSRAIANKWYDSPMGLQQFQAALMGTTWFQTHSAAQRNWIQLSTSDPTEVKAQTAAKASEMKSIAVGMGVSLSDTRLNQMATDALKFGMTTNQETIAIGHELKYSQKWDASGTAGQLQDQFKKTAYDYGVNLKDEEVFDWVQNALTGQADSSKYTDYIKNQVKAQYPGMSKMLDAGMTTRQIASPYLNSMQNILEIDPNSVDLTKDKTLQKAFAYRPTNTSGKTDTASSLDPQLMPTWQFEDQLRQDPRWMQTDNARNSFMDTANNILQKMGLVS